MVVRCCCHRRPRLALAPALLPCTSPLLPSSALIVSSKRRTAGVDRPNGFVFAHIDGRPYSPSYLTHHFRAPQERHGLPPIRFHDLRHGAAILALASGADLKAIQDTLGHASIVLTADTYTVVLPEVAGRTAEGIATS